MQLVGVTLLAAVVQSASGLGFALLAVPVFLLVLQSGEGVQLGMVLGLVICAALTVPLWREVPRRTWALLLIGSLVGFPLGLALFATANLYALKLAVATAILGFAVLTAALPRVRPNAGGEPPSPRTTSVLGIGLLSGAMTTSLGMPGPPVALYLTGLGAEKLALRAIALSLFTTSYAAALAFQSVTVGVSRRVWLLSAVLIPVGALGAFLGHKASHHLNERVFRGFVLALLMATACYMLIATLA